MTKRYLPGKYLSFIYRSKCRKITRSKQLIVEALYLDLEDLRVNPKEEEEEEEEEKEGGKKKKRKTKREEKVLLLSQRAYW